jgi:transposase
MWCVPDLTEEYIERMEDVLAVLEKPFDARRPVIALDERPVQLLDSKRPGRFYSTGKLARKDYEYVRCGTANIFCIVEPLTGRRFTHATKNRKTPQFARAMKRIAKAYPHAKTIHIVMDNLSSHSERALTTTFGEKEGKRLWSRFEVHYTPKHGSWLNPAEIEVSLWSRECLGRRRVPTLNELKKRTHQWNSSADRKRRTIQWSFGVRDARRVFGYE